MYLLSFDAESWSSDVDGTESLNQIHYRHCLSWYGGQWHVYVNYIDYDLCRLNDCHRHVYYINPEVKSMHSNIEYAMILLRFTALETQS